MKGRGGFRAADEAQAAAIEAARAYERIFGMDDAPPAVTVPSFVEEAFRHAMERLIRNAAWASRLAAAAYQAGGALDEVQVNMLRQAAAEAREAAGPYLCAVLEHARTAVECWVADERAQILVELSLAAEHGMEALYVLALGEALRAADALADVDPLSERGRLVAFEDALDRLGRMKDALCDDQDTGLFSGPVSLSPVYVN